LVPILVKVDQKCDRESARSRLHTLTDASWFYNLSHAICHGCGADTHNLAVS